MYQKISRFSVKTTDFTNYKMLQTNSLNKKVFICFYDKMIHSYACSSHKNITPKAFRSITCGHTQFVALWKILKKLSACKG